jgi:hypothetical protein
MTFEEWDDKAIRSDGAVVGNDLWWAFRRFNTLFGDRESDVELPGAREALRARRD